MDDMIPLTNRTEMLSATSAFHSSHGNPHFVTRHLIDSLRVFQTMWKDTRSIVKFLRSHVKHAWTHLGFMFVVALWIAGSICFCLMIPMPVSEESNYCDPGGNFGFTYTYNSWALKNTFQITIGFGQLTFDQAKAIDVVWDVILGRGGQALLVIVCFRVFTKSLNRMLEQSDSSISYEAFRAIVFEKASLTSIFMLARETRSAAGWRSKMSILWMTAASIYVMAFPTMTSAMTGYGSNVAPYFNTGGGNKDAITAQYFHRAVYRIKDADRIENLNLSSNYIVGSRGFADTQWDADNELYICLADRPDYGNYFDCALAWGISEYMEKYHSNSSQRINSTLTINGTAYSIKDQPLSVETFNSVGDYGVGPLLYMSDPAILGQPSMYTTTNSTQVYTAEQIQIAGSCDSQPTYQWGFSFLLLSGFFIVTAIWTLGMYVMWTDAFWNCRLDRTGRQMGFYRGILDVSNAMWKDMLREPSELAPESKIRGMMAEKRNGGRVSYDEIKRGKLHPARRDDYRQFKQGVPSIRGWTEPWTVLHWTWFMALLLNFCLCSFIPLAYMDNNVTMTRFAIILGLMVAATFWLMTLVMLLAATKWVSYLWPYIPALGRQAAPRTSISRAWTVAFALAGFLGFYVAISIPMGGDDYEEPTFLLTMDPDSQSHMLFSVLISNTGMGLLSALTATIMLFVGVFSTVGRWKASFMNRRARSKQGFEDAVPLTKEVQSPVASMVTLDMHESRSTISEPDGRITNDRIYNTQTDGRF